MTTLEDKTNRLIHDLQHNDLSKSDLRLYYNSIITQFSEVEQFAGYSYYRYAGSLLALMLEVDDFENDPNIRQSMASIGYYILCKGMERYALETNGYFIKDKTVEQIELLTIRISLLLQSSASIKFSLRLCSTEVNQYYTPLMDNYQKESSDYADMLLCDSYTVKYLCAKPEVALFFNESAKFSNEIFKRFGDYGNIEERIEKGRNAQIRLYQSLKIRFEMKRKFTFE